MISNESSKNVSLLIIFIAFVSLMYTTFKAVEISNKTQISTSEGVYTSYISTSESIEYQANSLTKMCTDTHCKVQKLLDFTSSIPYKTHQFQQKSPQKTIQENFGDCDDKSNLLISMLHSLGIEAYFVLVPKHIFVIVPLEDKCLSHTKGLWVNAKKYYILESTAKDSKVGFPLKYRLGEIDVIIDPFSNNKIEVQSLKYEL